MVDKMNSITPGSIGKPGSSMLGKSAPGKTEGKDFKQLLIDSLDQVNRLQQEAQTATEKLVTGQTDNVAEVFSAVKKADVAFSLMMQIRNQLMNSYTEIRNMRI